MRSNTSPLPELPTLRPGITELVREGRSDGALQALVVDHVLRATDRAVWLDSRENATTHAVARIAPSSRTLDRIAVARAFTAFQHVGLVETLDRYLSSIPARAPIGDPSIVVVPDVDWWYRADDLHRGEGDRLLTAVMDRLERIGERLPVLLTVATDAFESRLASYVGDRITCRTTPFGPRLTSDSFDTLVYPGNGSVQTTFAFWRQVLTERHVARSDAAAAEVTARGAN